MAKERRFSIGLPNVDDLFSSEESRQEDGLAKIREIPLDLIDEFPNHPFKVKDDEDMMHMVHSVQENGILVSGNSSSEGRWQI